jgi:hypothetical protein
MFEMWVIEFQINESKPSSRNGDPYLRINKRFGGLLTRLLEFGLVFGIIAVIFIFYLVAKQTFPGTEAEAFVMTNQQLDQTSSAFSLGSL